MTRPAVSNGIRQFFTSAAPVANQDIALYVVEGGAGNHGLHISREVKVLALLLILLQVWDGLLTAVGVGSLGVQAEGNVLLASLMHQVGYIPALAFAKIFAIVTVCLLSILSTKIHWVPVAMKCFVAIYMLCAIIPWHYVIFTRVL